VGSRAIGLVAVVGRLLLVGCSKVAVADWAVGLGVARNSLLEELVVGRSKVVVAVVERAVRLGAAHSSWLLEGLAEHCILVVGQRYR
jgi:hypothetical protein